MQTLETREAILLSPQITPSDDIRIWIGLLTSGTDEQIKQAAQILTSVGSAIVADLIAALTLGKPESRRAAAWVLGEIADPSAEVFLLNALHDPETSVQLAVIYAVGQVGADRSFKALTAFSMTGDAEKTEAIQRALRLIKARMDSCPS